MKGCTIQVINTNGKIIIKKKLADFTQITELDISSLPKGIYHVLLTSNRGQLQKTFIKL